MSVRENIPACSGDDRAVGDYRRMFMQTSRLSLVDPIRPSRTRAPGSQLHYSFLDPAVKPRDDKLFAG